jgi:hypothetical protein
MSGTGTLEPRKVADCHVRGRWDYGKVEELSHGMD